jgi:hypothetical protein
MTDATAERRRDLRLKTTVPLKELAEAEAIACYTHPAQVVASPCLLTRTTS